MGRSADVEQALDALYAAPPAAFIETRDALAKRLKADGDDGTSARVKALRKPTAIAYVLNQLSRRQPGALAELVDVGRVLARAQRKALRGEAGHDLRDAITKQRAVVTTLTTKTAALMKELGVAASGHLDEIAGALQAALVDAALGEQLEGGRLDKVPETAAGFPGTASVPANAPRPTGAAAKASLRAKARHEAAAKARHEAAAKARHEAAAKARHEAAAKAAAKASALAQARAARQDERDALEARATAMEAAATAAVAVAGEARRAAKAAAMEATAALVAAKRARQAARSARRCPPRRERG